jgi:hypothetical protein
LTGSRWNLVRPGWEKDPANRELREPREISAFRFPLSAFAIKYIANTGQAVE